MNRLCEYYKEEVNKLEQKLRIQLVKREDVVKEMGRVVQQVKEQAKEQVMLGVEA